MSRQTARDTLHIWGLAPLDMSRYRTATRGSTRKYRFGMNIIDGHGSHSDEFLLVFVTDSILEGRFGEETQLPRGFTVYCYHTISISLLLSLSGACCVILPYLSLYQGSALGGS
jgi:hypothetical protein